MTLKVYLSGEIHTDWREQIEQGARDAGLPVRFTSPVTDHASSDDCGVAILGDGLGAAPVALGRGARVVTQFLHAQIVGRHQEHAFRREQRGFRGFACRSRPRCASSTRRSTVSRQSRSSRLA